MKVRDFEHLLEILKDQAIGQNESYKNDLISRFEQIERDSPQYLDIIIFVELDFNMISNKVKYGLVKIVNTYNLCAHNDHWMKIFYLIRNVLQFNRALKYQYQNLKLPFGDDEEKYNQRIENLIKKYKKSNMLLTIPKLSPHKAIKFLQNHFIEELQQFYSFNTLYKKKREKDQARNELIMELIKLITIDNYKDIQNKNNIRITKKSKDNYNTEMDLILYPLK